MPEDSDWTYTRMVDEADTVKLAFTVKFVNALASDDIALGDCPPLHIFLWNHDHQFLYVSAKW